MSGKTALLDLDGTLLPIETDDFIKKYFILLRRSLPASLPVIFNQEFNAGYQ